MFAALIIFWRRDTNHDTRLGYRDAAADVDRRGAVAVHRLVDIHGRLSPDEAIWFCRQVEPLGMFLVEDPIRSEHAAGSRRIRQHINCPADGGITGAKKCAAMAETHLSPKWLQIAGAAFSAAPGLRDRPLPGPAGYGRMRPRAPTPTSLRRVKGLP
jgi:hypothetical protein